MPKLLKVRNTGNLESHNSLKLNSISIQSSSSNFLYCHSLDSNTVRFYLHLIQKDSVTHMHCLIVHMQDKVPFTHNLSLKVSKDSNSCFQLSLLS